jgi:predicted metal-dependent HD superfamily phosphohydrolase
MITHSLSQDRWIALWRDLGSTPPAGSFEELVSRYSEPDRHYHNAVHIVTALKHFDTFRGLARRPALVEFALWLHDVVYDPRASDNEAKSADMAERFLVSAGLGHLVDETRQPIMATAHTAPTSADDTGLVVDIDLSVLALPPAAYEAYTRAIRREYQWVPDDLFRAGRRKVLDTLMAMPALYSHPTIIATWEDRARANIEAELKGLQ